MYPVRGKSFTPEPMCIRGDGPLIGAALIGSRIPMMDL
jgi:hypothetical protein